jgi:hypothetical protein
MRWKYFIFSLLFFAQLSFAQGEGALPSSTIQESPLLLGAGSIGAAIPTNDALGFYYNPAMLGYSSQQNHISFLFMPQKTNWLPDAIPSITFNVWGLNVGYNFYNENKKLPLSLGFGFVKNTFDYGQSLFDSKDILNTYSLGASYKYYVLFNLGFSVKKYSSTLGSYTDEGFKPYKADGTAYDFGAMVIAPISQLFFNDVKFQANNTISFKPDFNFTLGYAVDDIGKKISYIDASQADPLTRTARLGYTFDFGINMNIGETKLSALNYSFTAEASNVLLKFNSQTGSTNYQGLMGDIKFGTNLIRLKGDQQVTVRRGHIFKLFETIVLVSGRFDGEGYDNSLGNSESNGFGFSTQGVFKFLSNEVSSPALKFITKHLMLEYYNINDFSNPGSSFKTNLKSITCSFVDIPL